MSISADELGPNPVECDVAEIKNQYGPTAKFYAKTRSAAAGMAGNQGGKEHWKRVAAKLSD